MTTFILYMGGHDGINVIDVDLWTHCIIPLVGQARLGPGRVGPGRVGPGRVRLGRLFFVKKIIF